MEKIWIDADSCPVMIRDYVIRYSNKLNIPLIFVANKQIQAKNNQKFEMIICEQKKDAADDYILTHAGQNELVITRDILFAEKLVKHNIKAINDRGTEFTKENISELRSERDFDMQLVEMGLSNHQKGTGYDKKNFAKFANCFDKIIHSN